MTRVTLVPLTDLNPWLIGWEAMLSGQPPGQNEPPRVLVDGPRGRAAVRALIDETIESRNEAPAHPRDETRAMRRAARARSRPSLWPAATAAVQEARGFDEYDAAAVLGRVVNTLADLFQEERKTFGAALREQAIEASVDSLLSGTPVSTEVEGADTLLRSRDEASHRAMMAAMEARDTLREAWLQWARDFG